MSWGLKFGTWVPEPGLLSELVEPRILSFAQKMSDLPISRFPDHPCSDIEFHASCLVFVDEKNLQSQTLTSACLISD